MNFSKSRIWDYFSLSTTEALTKKTAKNPTYPFTLENNVFVSEYFNEDIWKGILLLIVVGLVTYFYRVLWGHFILAGFIVMYLCFALILLVSGALRRRLVVDHCKKEYCYYLNSLISQRGPLHHIYIRMVAQKVHEKLMFKLILKGKKTDLYELSGVTEEYEVLEYQGKMLAGNLNLNYFDYMNTSKRHVVLHKPCCEV